MKIKDLLDGVEVLSSNVDGETEVSGISYDSQTTRPGDVFVAIAGTAVDGTCFLAQALEKGAVCAVCGRRMEEDLPTVVVESPRRALAVMAGNYFDHPAREMTLVGITGTNGKTTTTYFIKHILEQTQGARVGLIGTVCNWTGSEQLPTERTTPESYEVQHLLRQMADAGCSHVVMEVSSHALALDRVYGIPFAVAAFTNLTQDHLDFHHTMENYAAAKARLFQQCDCAVYNADDPWHAAVLQGSQCRRFSFGIEHPADLQGRAVSLGRDHVNFCAVDQKNEIPVRVAVPGMFTAYNALTALSVCWNLGIPLEECAKILYNDHGAKGRMEVIPTPGKPYTVLIDYAHTPDALENVLRTAHGFTEGRVVALFGCGGDRDQAKRPQMGKIAGCLADSIVITSDNPRTEDPAVIAAQIVAGIPDGTPYRVVLDRREAVTWALDHARAQDVILLCGKGHETYVEVNHRKYHQDEREIVADYLKKNSG